MKGRVGVELTLSPGGKLITRRVVKSSGVHLLDETAMANLERVPFPTPPGWAGQRALHRDHFLRLFNRVAGRLAKKCLEYRNGSR